MDTTRCPKCNKRLMAMTDRTGRTELRCLKCDEVDPIKTVAVKWADGPLAAPLDKAQSVRRTGSGSERSSTS
jgi:phage FluMu protein Com